MIFGKLAANSYASIEPFCEYFDDIKYTITGMVAIAVGLCLLEKLFAIFATKKLKGTSRATEQDEEKKLIMEKNMSPTDWLIEQIERCNQELDRLAHYPEEAEQEVSPGRYFESDQFKITLKNKIELDRGEYVDQLRRRLARLNLGVRSSLPTPEHEDSGSRYIAFLDILGFSDIVNNNSLEEMTRLMNFIHRDVQMGMTSKEVGKTKFKLYSYGFAPDLSETPINVILLSDTIVFWTKDDSPESFYLLVRLVNIFMNQEAYYLSIGLRGAITLGELGYIGGELNTSLAVLNFSTIYGKALVEAYHHEKNQEWIGCVVTDKAVHNFTAQHPNEELAAEILNKFLIRYEVPYKAGTNEPGERYVVRWPRGWRGANDSQHLANCFTRHQKIQEIPAGSVQTKHDNTLAFIEYVERVYKAEHPDGEEPAE